MSRRTRLASLVLGLCLSFPALAQPNNGQRNSSADRQPAPARHVRGSVESLQGDVLTVTTGQGEAVKVTLGPATPVLVVAPSNLSTIKRGTFVGTAATGPESHLVAREVVVFPPAMKGTGEGHYPWDLGNESTMTNATVAADVTSAEGRELTLSYKGGEVKVLVPENAPVVALEPGERSMLTAGAKVFVPAIPKDDALVARAVLVGKDSLTPPM